MILIDADKLKEYIKNWNIGNGIGHGQSYILDAINVQPTVYDVDKIVEQLEEEKHVVFLQDEELKIRVEALDDAIEIVKQGGVSDDVCEWESGKSNDEWKPSCEPNSTYNVFGVAWFRKCPYCGKKMKIVGD